MNSGRIPEIQNFNPLKICPIRYFTFGLWCVQVTIPNTLCVGSSAILVLLLEATCILLGCVVCAGNVLKFNFTFENMLV